MAMRLWEEVLEKALEYVVEKTAEKAVPNYFDNEWHRLASSKVGAFKYDPASSLLDLEFKGVRQYRYFNIDASMVIDLATSSSPGGWWWQNLKGAPAQKM